MRSFTHFFSFLCFCYFFTPNALFAQDAIPDRTHEGNGGEYKMDHADCVPDALRAAVLAQSDANLQRLILSGRYTPGATADLVSLGWPLRTRVGFTDPGYYGISNYVDENPAANAVLEYNCGQRTYDGHKGTDIAVWPFPWTKMANNDVEVVAAAAGVITYKADGNFDQRCAFNNNPGNAIIIRHSDGSQGLYWHFKSGSLTTKAVGAAVAKGEFLGRVGSSGNSTGPHLHFEVQTSNGTVIDPWGGPCNNLGGQSWWQSQVPHRDPRILKVMTHNADPAMPQCPPETVNASNYFSPGQKIYFGSYFRDRISGMVATYTVKQPNGTVWQTWTQTPNATSSFYWWYWWFTLPNNAVTGTWTFQLVCNGQTATHSFQIGPSCVAPTNLTNTNTAQNTSTCNWGAVPNATNYTVQFLVNANWVNVGTSATTSLNVFGLVPNATYQWRVLTNCPNGQQSSPSATRTFSTSNVPNCTGGTQYPALALTPNANWQYQSQLQGGRYCLMNVTNGTTYTFSFCAANGASLTFDGQLSIRNTSDQLLSYNNDFCGTAPKIVWQANFTGQVRVLLTRNSCLTQATNSTLAYRTGAWLTEPTPGERTSETTPTAAFPADNETATATPTWSDFGATSEEALRISVAPNPNQGFFRVSMEAINGLAAVQVLDITGRIMLEQSLSGVAEQTTLDVNGSNWVSGVYLVKIMDIQGAVKTTRVCVTR